MEDKFNELFNEKIKSMTTDEFRMWLCAAYGSLTTYIRYSNIPKYKQDMMVDTLKQL